jgi:hypothetical protein
MPKAKAIDTITLHRDGKNIEVPSGAVFDFTKAEMESIKSVNPGAITSKVEVDLAVDDVKTVKGGDKGPSTTTEADKDASAL